MSFIEIKSIEIANGAPIDTYLLSKIKNDLEDLNSRVISYQAPAPLYVRNFSSPSTVQSAIEGLGWADTLPANQPTISNNALRIPAASSNALYRLKLNQLGLTFVTGTPYTIRFYISEFVTGWADNAFYIWLEMYSAAITPFTQAQLEAAAAVGYIDHNFIGGPGSVNWGSPPVSDIRIGIQTANNGTAGVLKFNKIEVRLT